MLLLRTLSRLIGVLLMVALALVCLGVALYCLDGLVSLGSIRPDRLLHLPRFNHHVGHFLAQIAASGSTAGLALAAGVVAILIGLLLLLGVLRSSKERLVVLKSGQDGTLAARSRTMRVMVQSLAEHASGTTAIKRPKLKLSRRGTRGRVIVTASRAVSSDASEVEATLTEKIEPLSGPFHLRPRIRLHVGERGERVL